ncbi:MAG TPA: hypothetical protein DEA22_00490 [Blastocatellia bacterium]|nr:hypothetical protein [Blastocatellia bacterium]
MIGKRVEIKTRHWFRPVRDPQTRLQSWQAGLAQPNNDSEEKPLGELFEIGLGPKRPRKELII